MRWRGSSQYQKFFEKINWFGEIEMLTAGGNGLEVDVPWPFPFAFGAGLASPLSSVWFSWAFLILEKP